MSPSRLLLVLAALALPLAASAQLPRLKVALDMNSNQAFTSQSEAAMSVKRRVATTLVPALESAGYQVVRVKNYRDARRASRYQAIIRVNVEARDVYLATDAHVFDKEQSAEPVQHPAQQKRKHVEAELNQSVEAWADWIVWDGEINRKTGVGKLPKRMAAIEGSGDSSSLDDEENISRILAEELAHAILPAVNIAVTPRARIE